MLETAAIALALGLSIVSIALRYLESPPELQRRITALELELQEHLDTVSRWMKRENVRRARDAKEGDPTPPGIIAGAVAISDKKAELRARARARNLQ